MVMLWWIYGDFMVISFLMMIILDDITKNVIQYLNSGGDLMMINDYDW